jgi:hypothetical protein
MFVNGLPSLGVSCDRLLQCPGGIGTRYTEAEANQYDDDSFEGIDSAGQYGCFLAYLVP